MTPNNNTTTYNDAPEELLIKKLKAMISELTNEERAELLSVFESKSQS